MMETFTHSYESQQWIRVMERYLFPSPESNHKNHQEQSRDEMPPTGLSSRKSEKNRKGVKMSKLRKLLFTMLP